MNEMLRHPLTDAALRRRSEVFKILKEICQDLELTETQFERARSSYEAVADWLADSDDPLLASIYVYLQGSGALGTSTKPIGRDEFDVDLIGFAEGVTTDISPTDLKQAIGNRLAEHAIYAKILEEKKRCWRLNYAGDFHLDISPTIANPNCKNGGELVPDRKLREWHPTNPRGYKMLFDHRAALQPKLTQSIIVMQRDEAVVEPFPVPQTGKGILRRVVQLLKRHRDYHFLNVKEEVAPISIIITTLAMRAYEYCVTKHVFADELEVLVETIRMMPHFIDHPIIDSSRNYAIWNETTSGENFADRWNTEPRRVQAFYDWHSKALSDFESLRDTVGLDTILKGMKEHFGDRVVNSVMTARNDVISQARETNNLFITPTVGLSATTSAAATPVPKNDFFGD